jgi:hypothetical protein
MPEMPLHGRTLRPAVSACPDVPAKQTVRRGHYRQGDNLIVFPHFVRSGLIIVVVRSVDPRLVK